MGYANRIIFSETDSLASYIDRITQLTEIMNTTGSEKLHLFIHGLKSHVLEALLISQPENLDDAISFAKQNKKWIFIKP